MTFKDLGDVGLMEFKHDPSNESEAMNVCRRISARSRYPDKIKTWRFTCETGTVVYCRGHGVTTILRVTRVA